MAVDPPSRPLGTSTVSDDEDAQASLADSAPTRTCGTAGLTGKSSPSSVTRPPSIAHSGRTDVRRPMRSLADARSHVCVVFVELDVPVEVIAPRFRSLGHLDRDADRG